MPKKILEHLKLDEMKVPLRFPRESVNFIKVPVRNAVCLSPLCVFEYEVLVE